LRRNSNVQALVARCGKAWFLKENPANPGRGGL
jgi:hypothetical protein